MRKAIFIICVIAISYPAGASALVGVSIGGKVGITDYRGDIFPGSGDLGTGTTYTVILAFGTVPVVDFQLRASYFTKDLQFSYEFAGEPIETSFEYHDVGMTALLTKDLFSPPGSPLSIYIGGGVGYHMINTEVAMALADQSVSPDDADDPFTLMENTGKMSGEGVAGLEISAPGVPLAVFGEFKYSVIFASSRLRQTEYAAGLMIRF